MRLREIREQKRYSQRDLAKLIGTSQQQIDRWEKGQKLSTEWAGLICTALKVSIESLSMKSKKKENHMKFKVIYHIELDESVIKENGADPVEIFHSMTESIERHLNAYYPELSSIGTIAGPDDK